MCSGGEEEEQRQNVQRAEEGPGGAEEDLRWMGRVNDCDERIKDLISVGKIDKATNIVDRAASASKGSDVDHK